MRINLVFASDSRYGGHCTFTAHLMLGLAKAGAEVYLFRVRDREEPNTRPFGYGVQYRNVTMEAINAMAGVTLITATDKNAAETAPRLLKAGARIVIHDPTELKGRDWDISLATKRPIIIRKSMLKHLAGGVFIKHPYVRVFEDDTPHLHKAAVSISRIDFDKHTEILLAANQKLGKRLQIEIYGKENRLYSKFKLMKQFPEWRQDIHTFDKSDLHLGAKLCGGYAFMTDMSAIVGDGGGTQYTFLEAMDAGSVCILNRAWFTGKASYDVMKENENCLAVENADELIGYIRSWGRGGKIYELMDAIRERGNALVKSHDACRVAKIYMKELG